MLPREDPRADRELARGERVVRETVVAARVLPALRRRERRTEVVLPVDRHHDVVLDERAEPLLDEEAFDAEPDVEVVDAVEVEPVALDARDRGALFRFVRADDVARVIERVGQVEAEAERRMLVRPAQIRCRDAAEFRTSAATVETDRTGPVDEPQLGGPAHVENLAEVAEGLETEVGVAENLEERGLVRRVRVRVCARAGVTLEPRRKPHRQREVAADVVHRIARDRRSARLARAREARRAEEVPGVVLGDEGEVELPRREALGVLQVNEAHAAGERRGLVDSAIARLPLARLGAPPPGSPRSGSRRRPPPLLPAGATPGGCHPMRAAEAPGPQPGREASAPRQAGAGAGVLAAGGAAGAAPLALALPARKRKAPSVPNQGSAVKLSERLRTAARTRMRRWKRKKSWTCSGGAFSTGSSPACDVS